MINRAVEGREGRKERSNQKQVAHLAVPGT
jgi:hypothetical protein